jgi:hypothetical protein
VYEWFKKVCRKKIYIESRVRFLVAQSGFQLTTQWMMSKTTTLIRKAQREVKARNYDDAHSRTQTQEGGVFSEHFERE